MHLDVEEGNAAGLRNGDLVELVNNKRRNFMNKISNMIDHTVLKATASKSDIEKICEEAIEYGFFSVCVNPTHIEYAKKLLEGSNVKVCTV